MSVMPAVFLSHGAPTLPLEDCPARDFLRGLWQSLPRPRAILAISAHWETASPVVSNAAWPETIHDFSGFPQALYQLRYPAPGAPELAMQVRELTGAETQIRGLDHGVWVPLLLAYSDADIPVAQLSIQPHLGPAHHHRLGEALRPLRDDGVLILASGAVTHNLRAWRNLPLNAPAVDWAEDFAEWLAEKTAQGDTDALLDYRAQAPQAAQNHPTDEHLLPFFVALGAGRRGKRLHKSTTYGILAMDCYEFSED